MEVETNSDVNNPNINCHLLSDTVMRSLGFGDWYDRWVYMKDIDKMSDIYLSVRIYKDNPGNYCIDVIDDDFGQPYDYQYILSKNPSHEFALKVKSKVEKEVWRLVDAGVISGHKRGAYI